MMSHTSKLKLKNIDWVNTLFLILTPILAVWLISYSISKDGLNTPILIAAVAMYFLSGLSITAGYHRLFSHRAYKVDPVIKFILLVFGAGAFQNSALKWCTDHRRHHTHCDDEADPYNISKGFFWAHMGWIFVKEEEKYNGIFAKDLAADKMIAWQHKYYIPIAIFSGFIIPTFIGHLMGSALAGLAFIGLGRLVFVHHCTFFINSWAHMWGSQPYTDTNTALDNPVLAFFSYGEGYHNFHHFFQNDYRNGVKWWQYDPTKWLINFFNYVGLADSLKKTSEEEILRAQLLMKEKRLARSGTDLSTLEQIKSKIDGAFENLQQLRKEFKQTHSKELEQRIKLEMRYLKRAISDYSRYAVDLGAPKSA